MVVIAHTDRAEPDLAFGKLEISSACESGIIGPATAPCRTRKAINMPIVGASAHRNDAATNSASDQVKSRT